MRKSTAKKMRADREAYQIAVELATKGRIEGDSIKAIARQEQ
jgi:hypothetical protein